MKGFLYLVYLYFHQQLTVGSSEILSQQNDVVRPEFELTSPLKKSIEVKVVDRLASS